MLLKNKHFYINKTHNLILKLINTDLLDSISAQAKKNPRLRMNFNFHEELVEPGTVIFECKDSPYAPLDEADIFVK